jgi:Ca2+-binding RTX toxin-like protein
VEIFRANKGNDTIQGGTVNDQGTNLVDYRDAAGGGVNVNLATGSVTGADGTDTLVGAFHGVIGSADVDTLTGGGGDDFLDGRLGDDIIDGGGGNDRVAYNTASGGVNVNLAAGTATGAAGNDVLTSIEYARGSEHADALIGSDIANDLQGRAGDDNIQGGGGNDTIHGGMGNDTIDGGEGQDLARFSGLFSPDRYGVAIATNGVVTITDTLAGGDGIDTLSNIERFEFSDGRYKVNAGGTGLVADAVEITSDLDGVTNFDATSAIVLRASEPVTAVAGKMIRLMNDGGAGFNGESGDNDQSINVGSAAVTIQGNLIIIRPPFHLDLANAYHLEIDSGAFVGTSGLSNLAVTDPTALNFSTVTPGTAGSAGTGAAVASQAMDTATGNLKASFSWLDIQGTGNSLLPAVAVDVGAANVALVFKDYDPAGGDNSSDGVGAPDFRVRVNNFGSGDLVYVDNQNPSSANRLDATGVFPDDPVAGITTLSYATGTEGLGGLLEIDLAGTDATFESLQQLAVLLSISYNPVGEWTPPPST